MAFKFVIFLKVNRNPNPLMEPQGQFLWEVRELLSDSTGPLPERAGPTLGYGSNNVFTDAKAEAEAFAELLSQEDVYIYDTRDNDTPPSP